MNAFAVALEVPSIMLGPMLCRIRGHRWHVWPMHAASSLRVYVRCGRTS